MKTVGIIGGLGPETTAKFQLEIISSCLKNNKDQRPPLLMWNVPVPIKVEEDLLTKNGDGKEFLPLLKEGAKILEKAGADFLVMPCNTLHIFIDDIKRVVDIPTLSIIDETVTVLKKKKIRKVGVLATSKTISKNLFGNKFKANGIQQIIPSTKDQSDLDKIIHRIVQGKKSVGHEIKTNQIIAKMISQGVKNIILACTDLQLLIEKQPKLGILDTMQILAKASANEILKGGKNYERT